MTPLVKGILIGVIALVVLAGVVIGVTIGVGLSGARQAARVGNEKTAVKNLNIVLVHQMQYYTEYGRYGTFDQLVKKGLLEPGFAGEAPTINGYIFTMKVTPATEGQKASFTLNADPENAAAGTKHFFVDDTNLTIRVKSDQPARAEDPAEVK